MTIQNFTGPCVLIEKCVYKPEWSAWEKLIIVEAGQTIGMSDTWWNTTAYATTELALAANPEFTAIANYAEILMISGQLEINRPI
jgi:hypothetical protein